MTVDRATYLKVRQNGRIVSVAVIVAVDVNTDGRREVLGMDIGPSEAEPFWMAFLRKLAVAACAEEATVGLRQSIALRQQRLAASGSCAREIVIYPAREGLSSG